MIWTNHRWPKLGSLALLPLLGACDAGGALLAAPTWQDVLGVIISATLIYALLIVWSRLIGPRSFSQMTAFDFGVTVAIGAIIGGTATGSTPLWGGVLGLSLLFAIRALVGRLRRRGLDQLVDNRPILVMAHEHILEAQLAEAKITRNDVLEALRMAGITRFEQVMAVIVERNGELSVLRRDEHLDAELLEPVHGREHLLAVWNQKSPAPSRSSS